MHLKLIEGYKPSHEPTKEEMPHYDEDFIYIPLWIVYDLAEKHHVSRKSAFWHVLRHEILHIKKMHRPYNGSYRCWRDFQIFINLFGKNELEALPEPIDEEIKILNEAMKQSLKSDMRFHHDRFKKYIDTKKSEG